MAGFLKTTSEGPHNIMGLSNVWVSIGLKKCDVELRCSRPEVTMQFIFYPIFLDGNDLREEWRGNVLALGHFLVLLPES